MPEKTPFAGRLQKRLESYRLANAKIVLAVSGGADSVAMLRSLLELRDEWNLTLTVAHLNHQLRGEASCDDARWVESLCQKLGVTCVLGSENVREIAASRGRGLEETARAIRYEFLKATARRLGFTHVATAHTADDQAETILHNVIRGTGLAGLAGMPATAPLESDLVLVRPLLEITRAEVETYLRQIGQDYRQDETNLDLAFTRNRIRRVLLPLLKRQFNPQVEEVLRRLGRQAADLRDGLEQLTKRWLSEALLEQTASVCRLNVDVLQEKPRHLVRECLVRLWTEQGWSRQQMGYAEWDRLADLLLGESDGALTLPGRIQATRRGKLLMLACR